ncbi:MAG: response regulator transcription factor [Anaerolineaceae bacterium]|jgi:Response regulators consisting of a CheY-like receiver domain and a winged-helix DNA-binding domain
MKPRILLIEGKHADHQSFTAGLIKKGFMVESVPSGSAALAHFEMGIPDLAVIDSSSMRTSGKRICQSLHEKATNLPIILVIRPEVDPNGNYGADLVLPLPFTMQKLVNRIRHLLPVENNATLAAGPFQLDVEQRRVMVDEHQIRLTPRLMILFKILLEHPGEVIERERLFREAWETDYTGDTRSLDVHMSWLRQAVEENPRHPRYIKTIRGVGYRLDVDSSNGHHG